MSAARKREEWTPAEAAAYLGVHYDTVMRWAKEARSGNTDQVAYVRVEYIRRRPRYYLDANEIRALAEREPGDFA